LDSALVLVHIVNVHIVNVHIVNTDVYIVFYSFSNANIII